MLVLRTIAALSVAIAWFPLAQGCGSEDPPTPACAACAKHYEVCSFSGAPESLHFEIRTHTEDGCAGVVQGAPMHLKCDPLLFCWDKSGTCTPVTYDGVALWLDGGKCS